MEIKDFTVGQTVYTFSTDKRNNPPCGYKEAKIKKVGRIYITLDGVWERKFFIPEYAKNDNFLVEKIDYGADNLLFKSKQDYYIEKKSLESELYKARDLISTLSLEQLRAIKRIIQEEG